MARPYQQMRDYQRRHQKATSEAMKRDAKARQCPSCNRKAALKKHELIETLIYTCRWCGYEKAYKLNFN